MKNIPKNYKFLALLIMFAAICAASTDKVCAQQLPTPNFSVMEQWYEIVKWTYDDTGHLKLVVKPKSDPPQTHRGFAVRYFDEDGIDVIDINYCQIIGIGYNTPAGQSERVESGAPYESQLGKVKKVVVYRIRDDGTLVAPPNDNPAQQEKTTAAAPASGSQPSAAPKQNNPIGNGSPAAQSGSCSFDKLPPVKASDSFSESLIKNALYERYAFEANTGSLSAPGAIGVNFINIQIGKSYTNTVTNTTRGPTRRQDGAPVNAVIYPFKAVYIVCKKYAKETTKARYESDFVCFKDRTGNWNCPINGVPKIT